MYDFINPLLCSTFIKQDIFFQTHNLPIVFLSQNSRCENSLTLVKTLGTLYRLSRAGLWVSLNISVLANDNYISIIVVVDRTAMQKKLEKNISIKKFKVTLEIALATVWKYKKDYSLKGTWFLLSWFEMIWNVVLLWSFFTTNGMIRKILAIEFQGYTIQIFEIDGDSI